MKYIFSCFISALLLASCQGFFSKKIETDPPPYNQSLVFHQLISDQQKDIRLVLSRNYGVFDAVDNNSQWYIKGATVEWWQAGQKVLTLAPSSADSGFVYTGTLSAPLKAGETYEIRVSHPDYLPVRAAQVMPQPAKGTGDGKITKNVSTDSGGSTLDELTVTLQDEPGVKNYYEIVMSTTSTYLNYIGDDGQGNPLYDTIRYTNSVYFDNTFDPNIVTGINNTVLVSDQFFDGQDYKFIGRFYNYFGPQDSTEYDLTVRSVTAEYYNWTTSYLKQSNNQDNPFAEPVTVFNNLENGLGIFGLYYERTQKVK